MPTNAKSLVIFILFAVLCLENKAHRCGFSHKKTHKTTKLGKGKTSTTTPATTSKSTTTKPIKVKPKCNTSTVPSCYCGISKLSLPDDSLYYSVPKSGNCNDVFKRLSTTSDYHFREENCFKVQRAVCRVDSYCGYMRSTYGEGPTLTPGSFIIRSNTSEPFCRCCCRPNTAFDHQPIPKSGNCTDLETKYNYSVGCSEDLTVCRDICYCNVDYVDLTKCDPQTCNSASEPFCKCGIDNVDYPVPESGNCMDVLKQFSTTPIYFYQPGQGPTCYKARTVCKCKWPSNQCECGDECVADCEYS